MDDLLGMWRSLMSRHSRSPDIERVGRALLALWAQPHRRYHDMAHLRGILGYVEQLAEQATNADAVRLAAWYHDAVFAARPDDEELSAQLAEADLTALGVASGLIAEVTRLVRMTAAHDPAPGDLDAEVLSDADLAALAISPEAYQRNSAAIRTEFAHIADDVFRTGRAFIIEKLLAAPTLYRTAAARLRWEVSARANLLNELVDLRRPNAGARTDPPGESGG
ncbi:MAG TPA: metal-dependent phosphohydrolase [Mycobacterium sp.]|nr:metal-dependent phosphohydrolase [Mycobacterium sp.]